MSDEDKFKLREAIKGRGFLAFKGIDPKDKAAYYCKMPYLSKINDIVVWWYTKDHDYLKTSHHDIRQIEWRTPLARRLFE